MKKFYFPSLLLLSVSSIAKGDDIFSQMMQEMREMHHRMEKIFSHFEDKEINRSVLNKIEFKEDKDNIIVNLPLDSNKIKNNDITIEAKENNLEGTISYEDKKFNFSIRNGVLFETSYSYESSKEDEKDKKKTKQLFYNSSEYIQTLPAQVANLEKTTIIIEKNNIKISLPKLNRKLGWKKLEVKNS